MKLSTALAFYSMKQPKHYLLSWAYYAYTLGYSELSAVEVARKQLNIV
jgi:hypothetical protein